MSIWFMPWTYMLIPLLIWGMGKGSAWYWTQITGEKLTLELTHLCIALSAFYIIDELVGDVIRRHAERKTEEIVDATERKRTRDTLYSRLAWRCNIAIVLCLLLLLLVRL